MPTFAMEPSETQRVVRRMPVGAEVQPRGGVHFRLWAPRCRRVRVQLASPGSDPGEPIVLEAEEEGYYSVLAPQAAAGYRYWFLADDEEYRYPDPASRFQPAGPHGPSEVIDPAAYSWKDAAWKGAKLAGQVIYELHIGTFTPEGTWAAAERQLAELAAIGITLIEIMPVAEFPGRFNWGYDGVDLFAPAHVYGRPDDMRRFVDAAHALGVGVILDVVYNHIGPDGNYLKRFADGYFTDKYKTDWGEAINYDGAESAPVREFFIHNAGYWIEEFHLDGLRLDATQNIYDESDEHVIAALGRHARQRAGQRSIVIVAENEPQDARLVRPIAGGGYGLDGLWNDDFHHSAQVALRGHAEAYYSDYQGTARELLAATKFGYLYQGQWSQWQKKPRGTPSLDLPPWAFITFLENHDQISNSLHGQRLDQLSHPGRYRALIALLLLGPGTPMLFQGQEFGASSPFLFFADHHPELAKMVYAGRIEFLSQFPSLAVSQAKRALDNPALEATFAKCRLNLDERARHADKYRMHKDLLRLRREEPALVPRDDRAGWFDGANLSPHALLLRYFAMRPADERLLLINVAADKMLSPLAEPLAAPPQGMQWAIRWSSEDVIYGGAGTPALHADAHWKLQGESALWLSPKEAD